MPGVEKNSVFPLQNLRIRIPLFTCRRVGMVKCEVARHHPKMLLTTLSLEG